MRHTAHATKKEAVSEAKQMQEIYAEFAENFMAMPVVKGVKSESERFAGAEDTFTIEALMQNFALKNVMFQLVMLFRLALRLQL